MKRSFAYPALMALAGLYLAGCADWPPYRTPEPKAPGQWSAAQIAETAGVTLTAQAAGVTATADALAAWWTRFGDPTLDALVTTALANNHDLRIALARVEETRALKHAALGNWSPKIDAVASAHRVGISENLFPTLLTGQERERPVGSLGVQASWEVDVFGRVRKTVEEASAREDSAREDQRNMVVVLLADVASTYVEVRTLEARLGYAENNVMTQQGSLTLAQARNKAGLAPLLDVHQAQMNLSRTKARVPELRQAHRSALNRLAILLGQSPEELKNWTRSAQLPLPAEMLTRIPAETVRQRPDLRAAERRLAAESAQQGVVESQLWPQFVLNGEFTFASDQTGNFFEPQSEGYQYGGDARWNVFTGGKVWNFVRAQSLRVDQALLAYEQTVLRSLAEVEDSMSGYVLERERSENLAQAAASSEKTVELVRGLYRTGLTNFQNVLDMERSLSQYQDLNAESRGMVLQQSIALYRSLGGGWETLEGKDKP
jgi:outer membrane protein, multidrug efflux system